METTDYIKVLYITVDNPIYKKKLLVIYSCCILSYFYQQHARSTYTSISVTRADFEVFRPTVVTRCTNGGEIWHGVGVDCSTPNSPNQCGAKKLNFFIISEYKCPAGAYPLGDFYEIFRRCGQLHAGSLIKIWSDALKVFGSYRVCFPSNLQCP